MIPPATPVVDVTVPVEEAPPAPVLIDLTESPEVVDVVDLPLLLFNAVADEHEVALRRRRAQDKCDADKVFKQRRSSRLATKQPAHHVDALSKAKDVQGSRMGGGKGSPSLRRAVAAAGLDVGYPGFIPLPRLQELGEACGVDPDALVLPGSP